MGDLRPLTEPAPSGAVVAYHGYTTADGNLFWTSLVCDGLAAMADLSDQLVLIKSGVNNGQCRDIDTHVGNTLTVATPFDAQVLANVEFYVLPTVSESIEVATLLSRLTDIRASLLDNLTLGTTQQAVNFPSGLAEETIVTLSPAVRHDYGTLFLDVNELTQTTTVRVYIMVDGANYRLVDIKDYPVDFPAGVEVISIPLPISSEDIRVTFQSAVAEGAARTIHVLYGAWGAVP